MKNRRFSDRLPLRRDVAIALGDSHSRQALMIDISLGGSAVLTDYPVEVGSSLHLKSELPSGEGDKPFAAQCRVANVARFAENRYQLIGLEFEKLSDTNRSALIGFVRMF